MFIQNFVQNEVVELKEQINTEGRQIVSKSLVQREASPLLCRPISPMPYRP